MVISVQLVAGPVKVESKEQRCLSPPQRGVWSVCIVCCWLIHLLRSRGGSHSGTGFTLTHIPVGHQTQGWSSLIVNTRLLRTLPTAACGCAEPKRICWTPPFLPQGFVIPWRSCWVSCEVGVEEVWWIKLLSSLTHYTFPLDTTAWWITIGLEEAGGWRRGRGRKRYKRERCMACVRTDL